MTDVVECLTCGRWFPNTDGTRVCPDGHENNWDDDEAEYSEHLRKISW